MNTSQIFQKLFESDLSGSELEIIGLLEESFTDITPENSADYITVEDYFISVKNLFKNKSSINSNDIRIYIKELISKKSESDLLFLDGLNSLAECLMKYEGRDDLNSFEIWFNKKIKSLKA